MSNILDWMGRHPILTVILVLILCSTIITLAGY